MICSTILKNLGVSFVNWSVDTLDWKTKNADSIYNEIINNASSVAIILCHDLHGNGYSEIDRRGISVGYSFATYGIFRN